MKKFLLIFILHFNFFVSRSQTVENKIPILIRCDDIGMSRGVNDAAKKVLETGIPVSMSVMVPCGWFTDAVELLKQYPNVSVGIHLTLNAEWKQYRWGPVAGASVVPTLVDSLGYFFPSRSKLFGNNPSMSEIETELRAQIDKARRAGLTIDYLDYHMGAAMQTPETRAIVEKLAREYGVAISRYYDEVDVDGGYSAPIDHKFDTLVAKLKALKPGGTKLFVFHVALNTPEMSAMEDLNPFGPREMSRHRQAELDVLIAPGFQRLLKNPQFRLVNYKLLNKEKGLETMKRPAG
jgi:chitin disaccharide deacetylase